MEGVRYEMLKNIKHEVMKNTESGTWMRIAENNDYLLKLIVDCRNLSDIFNGNAKFMDKIESLSKDLCYKLYVKRLQFTL